MLPVLHFSASSSLLGQFRSPPLLMFISTALALVVLVTNAVLVWRVVDTLDDPLHITAWTLGAAAYTCVCVRLVWADLQAAARRIRRAIGSSCTILRYKVCTQGLKPFGLAMLAGSLLPALAAPCGRSSLR